MAAMRETYLVGRWVASMVAFVVGQWGLELAALSVYSMVDLWVDVRAGK